MSRAVSLSAKRAYGLLRVCRAWRLSRATVVRQFGAATAPTGPRRRPGPEGALPDEALAGEIRALIAASPLHGEGCRTVWARCRVGGLRIGPWPARSV